MSYLSLTDKTAILLQYNFDFVLSKIHYGLDINTDEITIKEWCRWIMKIIIRAGFLLVMDKEKTFTRDLFPCYIAFCKYYSNKKNDMWQALEYAVNPISNKIKLLNFINTFGIWMQEQIEINRKNKSAH